MQAVVTGLLTASAAGAFAQASAPSVDVAPSERAKRDAENPMRWILLHSDKPRKPRDNPQAAPATPAAAAVRKPAAAASAPAALAASAPAARPLVAASAPGSESPTVGTAAPRSAAPPVEPPAATVTAAAPSTAPRSLPDPAPPAAASPDDDDEEPLVALQQSPPSFPRPVMNELRHGAVQVRFTVQPDGKVVNSKVLKTSNRRLNSAALAAVEQWKFKPRREAADAAIELAFDLDAN